MGWLDRLKGKSEGPAAAGDTRLWRAIEYSAVPLRFGEELVLAPGESRRVVLSSRAAELLRGAHPFRTFDDHAAVLAARYGDFEQTRATLEGLAADGWLIERGALLEKLVVSEESPGGDNGLVSDTRPSHGARTVPSGTSSAPAIELFAVPSRDRAALAERCLLSHAEQCAPLDFLLADDSSSSELRSVAARVAATTGRVVRYAAREEKMRAASQIAELKPGEKIAPAVLDFALFGDTSAGVTIGANRNAMLLAAAGTQLVTADDDTVARFSAAEQSTGLKISSEPDPTVLRLHASIDRAIEAARAVPKDVIALHRAVLGKSAAGLIRNAEVDLDAANASLLRMLPSARAAVTMLGIAGDSGMASPLYLLTAGGEARKDLIGDYAALRRSRAVVRAPNVLTLSSSTHFMTSAVGYDLRTVLPPFFPVLRASDTIFGATLRALSPRDLIAHLPYAIEHRPPPRTFDEGAVAAAISRVRMSDLVRLAVRSCSFSPGNDRYSALGRHLMALGDAPLAAFEEHLRLERWTEMAQLATRLERAAAEEDTPPEHTSDLEAAIELLRRSLAEPRYTTPSDLGDEDALVVAQKLIRRFGELLDHWPAIFEAAASFRAGGGAWGDVA